MKISQTSCDGNRTWYSQALTRSTQPNPYLFLHFNFFLFFPFEIIAHWIFLDVKISWEGSINANIHISFLHGPPRCQWVVHTVKFTEPESEIKEKHEALFGTHKTKAHGFFSYHCKEKGISWTTMPPSVLSPHRFMRLLAVSSLILLARRLTTTTPVIFWIY